MSNNLETVIEDAITDSQLPVETETPEVEASSEEVPEVSAAPEAEVSEPEAETAAPEASATEEVAPKVDAPAEDDFEKRFGLQPTSPGGRENRIPYSRVKKISEKAVGEVAEAALGRKLSPGEKAVDAVKAHVARIPELETKVTDYESRLERVGQFEDIMANDPRKFLEMLSRVPAYKEFFDFVNTAIESQNAPQAAPEAQQQASTAPTDVMPEPDQELSDGSKVYSQEGLRALLEWNAKQAELRAVKQIEDRYKPLERDWQYQRQMQAVVPVIRKQIEEARTWPQFNENEEEITKALAEDENLSLEGAYRKIVLPKIHVDRDKLRQELIQELKTAPKATAVVSNAKSSVAPKPTGPRSLEDVIAEEVKKLK